LSDRRRGIQSVEIGGGVLKKLMDAGEPLMLRQIAELSGMTAAKVYPYLVSLARLGFVEQNAETGRYDLGPLGIEMGLASLRRLDHLTIASRAVNDLSQTTGFSVAISVWGDFGPTVVQLSEGLYNLHTNMRVGSVMSVPDTATGKVWAAFLAPSKLRRFLDSEHFSKRWSSLQLERMEGPGWEQTLTAIRERGMERAIGHPVPGANAFSAPVFDYIGNIVLTCTIMGNTGQFDLDWDGPVPLALRDCVTSISQRLGHKSRLVKAARR